MTRILVLVVALLSLTLAAPASAQVTIDEAGVTLIRSLDVGAEAGVAHGLSVDPSTGNAYFIGDGGRDLYRLGVDDGVTRIADNVGTFVGILSDLRVGPDGLLYVGDSDVGGGDPNGDVLRFDLDGNFVDTHATVMIGGGRNAFGLDFDCAGNLYAGETGDNLYRIDSDGMASVYSTGWTDIDEIERGENNELYVLDGTSRPAEWGTVFLLASDGSVSRYASGLPRTHAGTFDRGAGDVVVGGYTSGTLLRLRDTNGDGTVALTEVSIIASGLGTIVDVDYGVSSDGSGYSLYVVSAGSMIREFGGFGAPRFGGCGQFFDDDGDGVCDLGTDMNGDGDCDDLGEDTGVVDCDDDDATVAPGLMEICDDGLDNQCDGTFDLDDASCADFDTDMDGLPDVVELPLGDSDMDGTPDFQDPDDDGDGVPTRDECSVAMSCEDTDMDTTPDYLDVDDDGDGVATRDERPGDMDQDTDMDMTPDYLDVDDDGDGIDTATESADESALGAAPDDDGVDAYLDTDSDGDGVLDATEGTGDLDMDGVPNYLDADSSPRDTDMDGIRDDLECASGVDPCPDADMNGTPDWMDPDDDGDGVLTIDENGAAGQDTDGDGTADYLDTDDDGDGVATADECTTDPCEDTDADGTPDYLDVDDDGDGIDTLVEREDEAALGGDVDGDGVPAYLDTDSDGDMLGDQVEGRGDDDGDGAPNYLDVDTTADDTDGDGVPDIIECPTEPCMDSDGDGVPDLMDPDDDGDGIPTRDERPSDVDVDTDGDGNANHLDADDDNDGVLTIDERPDGANLDTDGDLTANHLDPDDDGDGIPTADERRDGMDIDSDGDMTFDYLDADDDGDGIPTSVEASAVEGQDVDGDMTPNHLDTDSDGDGRLDEVEGTGDVDGDGVPNYLDPDDAVASGAGLSGGACAVGGQSDSWALLLLAMMALGWRRRRMR